jgi:DNA recombination protein RmuC
VQNSIKQAGVRTRAIERQLKGVETLPGADAQRLLGEAGAEDGEEE